MLIETIKADRLQAMKAKDELKKNLLGTLYAAAAKETKTTRRSRRRSAPFSSRSRRRSGSWRARGSMPGRSGPRRRSSRPTCRVPCPRPS
jgi:hypothetical protein